MSSSSSMAPFKLLGKMIFPDMQPVLNTQPLQQIPPNPCRIMIIYNQQLHLDKIKEEPMIESWPELSPELKNLLLSIGVSKYNNPTLILSKKLTNSDVKKNLNRLSIPRKNVIVPFLTKQEEVLILGGTKQHVLIVDTKLAVHKLHLARWKYAKRSTRKGKEITDDDPSLRGYSYALIHGWMDVVNSNGLKAGDGVEIWSFRFNGGSVGFILVKVDKESVASSSGSSGVEHESAASSSRVKSKKRARSSDVNLVWGKKRKRGSNEGTSFSSMKRNGSNSSLSTIDDV